MLNSLKIENRMAKVKVRTRNQARSGYAIVRGQPRKRLRSSFSKSGTRNCVAAAALRGDRKAAAAILRLSLKDGVSNTGTQFWLKVIQGSSGCRRAAPARTSQSSGSKFRCSCRPA